MEAVVRRCSALVAGSRRRARGRARRLPGWGDHRGGKPRRSAARGRHHRDRSCRTSRFIVRGDRPSHRMRSRVRAPWHFGLRGRRACSQRSVHLRRGVVTSAVHRVSAAAVVRGAGPCTEEGRHRRPARAPTILDGRPGRGHDLAAGGGADRGGVLLPRLLLRRPAQLARGLAGRGAHRLWCSAAIHVRLGRPSASSFRWAFFGFLLCLDLRLAR